MLWSIPSFSATAAPVNPNSTVFPFKRFTSICKINHLFSCVYANFMFI
nr:MAG TPA: hypothetical protein [Bacteriophage sp.]